MAIFGMNGLQFVGLDLLLVFAVYGMARISMNPKEVAAVQRAAIRKGISKGDQSPEEKKRAAVEFRTALLKQMHSGKYAERYADTDKAFEKAYVAKTYVR